MIANFDRFQSPYVNFQSKEQSNFKGIIATKYLSLSVLISILNFFFHNIEDSYLKLVSCWQNNFSLVFLNIRAFSRQHQFEDVTPSCLQNVAKKLFTPWSLEPEKLISSCVKAVTLDRITLVLHFLRCSKITVNSNWFHFPCKL